MDTDDSAQWIWRNSGSAFSRNRFTWFRRTFRAEPGMPAEALIAADSTAYAWLNGVPILRGVTRSAASRIRADRVDLGRALRTGENVLLVLHHSWGDITTFQRFASVRAGLWVSGALFGTDTNWEWRAATELDSRGGQMLGLDGSPRIRYPIRLTVPGDDLEDDAWSPAAIISGPWPTTPRAVETPPRRWHDVRPERWIGPGPEGADPHQPGVLRVIGDAGDDVAVTVGFPAPLHGQPYVRLAATGRLHVTLEYAEIDRSPYRGTQLVDVDGHLDAGGVVTPSYADEIRVVDAACGRWELPEERTVRWMRVRIHFDERGEIDIGELGIVSVQFPTQLRGDFETGDAQIASFVNLALVHTRLTMTDTLVDTPGREDGQWIEDARLRAELAARWFGNSSLRRLAIRLITESIELTGSVHPFFPSDFPWPVAPWDWSMPWIGMVFDEYRWSADARWLAEVWPFVVRYWRSAEEHIDDAGMWTSPDLLGDVRVSRDLTADESSGLFTPTVIDGLELSAELARTVGDRASADRWLGLARRMRAAFVQAFVTDEGDQIGIVESFNRVTGGRSGLLQAAQARPVLIGLVTGDTARRMLDEQYRAPVGDPAPGAMRWNTPTWGYDVLRALTEHGRGDRAVAHLKDRYAPALAGHPRNLTPLELQGALGGPLPEYMITREEAGVGEGESLETQPIDATGSHGWAAVPLVWMHDTLLGVRVDSPGGAVLSVAPVSAHLPYVSGTTMTPRGPVFVHFEPQRPLLVVELPAHVEARLRLPDEFAGLVTVDAQGHVIAPQTTLGAGRHEFVAVAWDTSAGGGTRSAAS